MEIIGHTRVVRQLAQERGGGRWASAYVFYGPSGVGKRRVAEWFLQGFACVGPAPRPCGTCPACRQWAGGNYPDYHCLGVNEVVNIGLNSKELKELKAGKIKSEIGVGRIAGLRQELVRRPLNAAGHLVIIDEAESLNTSSANALLKTLEEPRGRPVIVLLTSRFRRILSTIRSRCRCVRFGSLTAKELERGAGALGLSPDPLALELAEGSLGRLATFLDERGGRAAAAARVWEYLAGRSDNWWDASAAGRGADLAARRRFAREAVEVVLLWWRTALRLRYGVPVPAGLQQYEEPLRHASRQPPASVEPRLAEIWNWARRLNGNVNPEAVVETVVLL